MSVSSGTSGISSRGARTQIPLAELRAEAGLSRERLASRAGLSTRTIYAIEREGVHPKLETRLALAAALRGAGANAADIAALEDLNAA